MHNLFTVEMKFHFLPFAFNYSLLYFIYSKNSYEFLPVEKDFKIPNVDNIIEEGKKSPTKFRKIILRKPDGVHIEADKYTASGWPSVSGEVLKSLAGKVSADFDFLDEDSDEELPEDVPLKSLKENGASTSIDTDTSAYGTAYSAFGGGQAGIEACHAIAALCEVCSIDSLISNFILPLQVICCYTYHGRCLDC